MTLRKGQPWGEPATGEPDVELAGDDHDLARLAMERPGVSVRFIPTPGSDLGPALGLAGDREPGQLEVPVDVLRGTEGDVRGAWAANAFVLGTPPDRLGALSRAVLVDITVDGRHRFTGRATTVVLATGQFLRGNDVVPRGHPGDGRFEIQAYSVLRRERAALRALLPSGGHVPHPAIGEWSGRRAELAWAAPIALEVDGLPKPRVRTVTVELVHGALRLRI